MIPMVALALALMASPGRADDPAGELCALTNCSGINFGTPRGRPKSEPYSEPKRCRECELETLRQLNESIASMEHPRPVVPLAADTLSILHEDVLAADADFELSSAALGLILGPARDRGAILAGAALVALNAAIRPHLEALMRDIPIWLNAISFSRAAARSKSCTELAAAVQSACANAAPAGCGEQDDCRTLLAKRAPLLECDRASLELRDSTGCPAPSRADEQSMARNLEDVKRCGRLISGKPECCPASVGTRIDKACKERKGSASCKEQNELRLKDLLASPGSLAENCRSARDKRDANQACGDAREAEAQCYDGQLDAGHKKAVTLVRDLAAGCAAFLDAIDVLGLCR